MCEKGNTLNPDGANTTVLCQFTANASRLVAKKEKLACCCRCTVICWAIAAAAALGGFLTWLCLAKEATDTQSILLSVIAQAFAHVPFIFAFLFYSRQYNKASTLEEVYRHKAAVFNTLESHLDKIKDEKEAGGWWKNKLLVDMGGLIFKEPNILGSTKEGAISASDLSTLIAIVKGKDPEKTS